jgi:signal transduction histidine kinase
MKAFTKKILTHRKIIFIFLLAILLPSLTVGYLSLSTFSKRRETVKKFLESNLLISGEAALKQIEEDLLDYEQTILKAKSFLSVIQPQPKSQPFFRSIALSKKFTGRFFLLNSTLHIIFPRTGRVKKQLSPQPENGQPGKTFVKQFEKAEHYEFSQQNYNRAAEFYRACLKTAQSIQLRARALEALGRTLFLANRYHEAQKTYRELYNKYKRLVNQAGHPYGIISTFQIVGINHHLNKDDVALKLLLDLYKEIREGIWALDFSSFEFFISEIESTLDKYLSKKKLPEFYKSYQELKKHPSSYSQALLFVDFLKRKAIPAISQRLELTRRSREVQIERFLSRFQENSGLISFKVLPGFHNQKTYYGGIYWDTHIIKNQFLPEVIKKIAIETGLQFSIVDDRSPNNPEEEGGVAGEGNHTFYFHKFPFNWKLMVSHPDVKNLEKEGQKEIILFGLLLTVILMLMLLGAFLITRDISRESETTRLKTEFVHNISHEFKTPLTLIRLYGETLQRKKSISEQQKYECYEIITKESERLSHLINNVLDFSRIEMDRKEFNFQLRDLSKTVEDTLESYRYHLEKKGFIIYKSITSNLPRLEFDEEAITSVLINLLSNAMKFSTKTKEVTVKLLREDNRAVLQVIDNGIGISTKDQKRIFQRFYRASDKVVSDISGSGLGLTLIKHIVNAHNGQIEVRSEPGKGSVFSVFLPFPGIQRGEE